MNLENAELVRLDLDELDTIMKPELGCFEEVEVGQEIFIPVAKDIRGDLVYFGPLDYSGKSNSLPFEDWSDFVKENSTWTPEYRTVVKKSDDLSKMWIFAQATGSIGPCDIIALFPSLFSLIQAMIDFEMDAFCENEETLKRAQDAIDSQDLERAKALCDEVLTHSFFTGLLYGPVEYVSGPKPTADGYAEI